jgi:hypothetical protein
VLEQAKALARRVTSERGADAARVDRAYALALGRIPTDAERARAMAYVRAFEDESSDDTKDEKPSKNRKGKAAATTTQDLSGWSSFCQALFASAEFRYLN